MSMSDNRVNQPGSIKSAAATVSPGGLCDLVVSFLRLGLTAFGGPAAHIAMMDEEFVRRRAWVSRTDFLDMLGASNLVPGPSSTEMAIHIGHQRAGWRGLIIAGVCFIFPAMMIVMICAWAYARFGSLPQVQNIMYGVKPVIIAIVFQALLGLARGAVKSGFLATIGLLATGGALAVASDDDDAPSYLFICAGDQARTVPDFLAVVNFTEDSKDYGKVIASVPFAAPNASGNEPHHIGFAFKPFPNLRVRHMPGFCELRHRIMPFQKIRP